MRQEVTLVELRAKRDAAAQVLVEKHGLAVTELADAVCDGRLCCLDDEVMDWLELETMVEACEELEKSL